MYTPSEGDNGTSLLKFPLSNYLFPAFCVAAGIVCQYIELDISLEQFFYDFQHDLWPYKTYWLTQDVLHEGGRDAVLVIMVTMALFFLATLRVKGLKYYRRSAGYILLASLTGMGIVAGLKATTHIYSPWDLQIFGGQYPNIRLFDTVADNLPVGHAFPSGHASGGFSLLSIYFVARSHHHRWSGLFLYGALGIGLSFGLAQQMRGAHMVSHDLFSLAICWSTCLVLASLLLPATTNEGRSFVRKETVHESSWA